MKIELEIEAKHWNWEEKMKCDWRYLNEKKQFTERVLAGFYNVFLPTKSPKEY